MLNIRKICIIGAGPAGLCAIRRSVISNFEVIAFEKQNEVGGTWNYTDETGVDENGIEIHPSMYQNLMTNVSIEIMQFPDFPYPFEDRSFLPSDKFLRYVNLYADKFGLRKHIKFGHEVLRVRPFNDSWEVIVRNIAENKFEHYHFDGILVCNGFSTPNYPSIIGNEIFRGKQVHSHDYRKPQDFEGENVLLIGSGPSGREIVLEIGKCAEKVFWSHHMIRTYRKKINMTVPEQVEEKPDVERVTENEVIFIDGSREIITMIVYATGYDLTFPFLSVDCGLSVQDKHIRPLFKHIININRPTMALIDIPIFALGVPLFDLQTRFVLKFWKNLLALPSKDQMLADTIKDEELRKAQNIHKRKFHFLGPLRHKQYYEELANVANIDKIPPVLGKMLDETVKILFENFNNYRNYNFRILNDEDFKLSLET